MGVAVSVCVSFRSDFCLHLQITARISLANVCSLQKLHPLRTAGFTFTFITTIHNYRVIHSHSAIPLIFIHFYSLRRPSKQAKQSNNTYLFHSQLLYVLIFIHSSIDLFVFYCVIVFALFDDPIHSIPFHSFQFFTNNNAHKPNA